MNINKKIYILLDYDKRFYSEWDKKEFNLKKFVKHLEEVGFETIQLKFSEVNFHSLNFKNTFILYSSSEVKYYKEYIEDILLGIYQQGGVLIPDFYLFRAHHNKSFQEIYKNLLNFGNLSGKTFGTFKEFSPEARNINFPSVFKIPNGAGSQGVFLVKNYKQALKRAKKLSNSFDCFIKRLYFQSRAIIAAILKIRNKERIYRNNARKFVVQEYVPNLNDDWKILIYGQHFYALNRKVRRGDFRASGSGKFSYIDPPDKLLEFCQKIFQKLETPYLALDIATRNNQYYMLEFQAVYFGIYTILHADFYYEKKDNTWQKRTKNLSTEKEMANSIVDFIKNHLELK